MKNGSFGRNFWYAFGITIGVAISVVFLTFIALHFTVYESVAFGNVIFGGVVLLGASFLICPIIWIKQKIQAKEGANGWIVGAISAMIVMGIAYGLLWLPELIGY